MKRRSWVAVFALAGVSACWLLRAAPGEAPVRAVAPAALAEDSRPLLAVRWPEGRRLEYVFEATGAEHTTMGVGQGQAAALMDVAGRMVVRSGGVRGDRVRLAVSLSGLERAEFRVMGAPLLAPGHLPAGEVQVELDARGRLTSAGVAPGGPEALVPVVAWLMSALQVAPQPARGVADWQAEAPAPLGDAQYAYSPCGALERGCVDRRLAAYTHLDAAAVAPGAVARVGLGHGQFLIDEAGLLTHAEVRERAEVFDPAAKSALADAARDLTFDLVSEGPDTAGFADLKLTPLRTASSEEQLLRQRVGDMTAERLLEDATTYADAAALPDHSRWLWQATGLLRLDPTLPARLAASFAEMSPGSPGRALVLDLLAQAGTAEAQAALRGVLSSPEAAGDPDRTMQYQRLSLVQAPRDETVRFALDALDAGEVPRDAALLTAGAVSGAACRNGAVEACRLGANTLRGALQAAKTPHDQLDTLRALGNAGFAGSERDIEAFVSAEAPEVRMGAALALRKIDSDAARASLLALASDDAPEVASRALMGLAERPLDARTLAGLQALAEGDVADAGIAEQLVQLLAPRVADAPAARAALEALSRRPGNPAGLQQRIAAALG